MPRKNNNAALLKSKNKSKPVFFHSMPAYDYLKHYRICRIWMEMRHGITSVELEFMLFLYGEPLFNWDDLKRWDREYGFRNRLYYRLRDKGFIETWLPDNKKGGRKEMMKLSYSAKMIIAGFYKVLSGEKKLTYSKWKTAKFPESTRRILELGAEHFNNEYEKRKSMDTSKFKGVGEK